MKEVLSLTLRDAQHLTLKTSKKIKGKTESNVGESSCLLIREGDLKKKTDEIVDTVKNLTTSVDSASNKLMLSKQLSDLLFAAFLLAEEHGINLEEAFLQRIDEFILELSN